MECIVGVSSQLSGHAVCILTALSTAVTSGVSTAKGHEIWPALLAGTALYVVSVVVRLLWCRDGVLPSFKMAVLGLLFGVVVSSGIDRVGIYTHHQTLNYWYQDLSQAQREQVRGKVHQWLEKQSVSQRASLEEAAQLLGYEFPEDYIVLNFCTPSNKELTAIWEEAPRFNPQRQ